MSKSVSRIGVAVLLVLLTAAVWVPSQLFSVQVREGKLREKPSFLGKVVATVAYGDRMTQVEEKAGWMKVRGGTKEGWIHGSAMTEKKVVLQAGEEDVAKTASGEEVALAGKGFNEEVEGEYRSANPQVDFTWIDLMETWSVKAEQAVAFLEEGQVRPGGDR